MVHKKYIKRNGKSFGPYYYENYRDENGITRTKYHGLEHPDKSKTPRVNLKLLAFIFLGIVIVSGFLFYNSFETKITTEAILELGSSNPELGILGNLNLVLNSGEFIPAETQVIITNNNQTYIYSLSDLISTIPGQGEISLSGTSFSGNVLGFATERNFPKVFFELEVFNENSVFARTGKGSGEIKPEKIIEQAEKEANKSATKEEEEAAKNATKDNKTGDGGPPGGQGGGPTGNVIGIFWGLKDSIQTGKGRTVQGEVSFGEEFVHQVKRNDVAGLVEGSVRTSEKPLKDFVLNLDFDEQTNEVIVTTDYSENVGKTYQLDTTNFSDLLVSGDIKIELIYNGTIFYSLSDVLTDSNLTIQTLQFDAVINKPVLWKKNVHAKNKGEFRIKLPKDATNIQVSSLNYVDTLITSTLKGTRRSREGTRENQMKEVKQKIEVEKPGLLNRIIRGLTGKVIQIEETSDFQELIIDENATEFEITYETPGPISIETPKGKNKEIFVTSETHFTNILAYTNLQEEVSSASSILLVEETNNTQVPVEFVSYDLNNNSLIDYIEWIVPSLSNRTYTLIIEISWALHLDENRTIISDITEAVKYLDGNWSETINENEFVRVRFEQILDSSKDITIFPRGSATSVEVYEVNETILLATFENITENETNKIYLTNLSNNTQDTFDLKVLGGSFEFDWIVDPPAYNGTNVVHQCGWLDIPGTYTMNQSISTDEDCLIINNSDITLDCDNFNIDGDEDFGDYGINVSGVSGVGNELTNVTIKNCNVTNFERGIYVTYMDNSTIDNVTANSNRYGIMVSFLESNNLTNTITNDNTETGFTISNSYFNNVTNVTSNSNVLYGIYLTGSDSNTLTNITANSNNQYGIYIVDGSLYNKIENANLINNTQWDFYTDADSTTDCSQTLTNVIGTDDKPIYFSNETVNLQDWDNNASEIILCGADNSVLNNITMSHTDVENNGFLINAVDNSNFTNIFVNDSYYGFYINTATDNKFINITSNNNSDDGFEWIDSSSNNLTNIISNSNSDVGFYADGFSSSILINITVNSNGQQGIFLRGITYGASSNILTNITTNSNGDYGTSTVFANDNVFTNLNSSYNSDEGLYLDGDGNDVINSTFEFNLGTDVYGIWIDDDSNTLENSTIRSNTIGIRLDSSASNNIITNNTIENNSQQGIYLQSSSNSIYNNLLNNTDNVYFSSAGANNWNTTQQTGTRIYSDKPEIGGNYWTNYSAPGTGFSDTCTDADSDGFCDLGYNVTSDSTCSGATCGNNVDYLAYSDEFTYFPTNCTTLSYPGTYTLQNDVSTTEDCFTIISSNVTLDCNNYNIDGDDGSGDYGIYSNGISGTLTNITINNCNLTNFHSGLYLRYSDDGNISNTNSSSMTFAGVRTDSSDGNNFTDISLQNSDVYGFYFLNSGNNLVTKSNLTSNLYGISSNQATNQFYDNFFNNTNTFSQNSDVGVFNTTPDCSGAKNIMGGDCIGGNYFADYGGIDADEDGLGDLGYVVGGTTSPIIDYHPLVTPANNNTGGITNCVAFWNSTYSGVYSVASDISTTGTCVLMTTSDVSLDCQNFNIDGDDSGSTDYGIYVDGASAAIKLSNITLQNCNVTDFDEGIKVEFTNFSNFVNLTATSNKDDGFNLATVVFSNFTNIVASSNTNDGFSGISANDNNLTNITTSNSGSMGIYLGSRNTLINATSNLNGNYGLQIAQENTVINLTADNNNNGVYASSTSNYVTNSTFSGNQIGFTILFDSNTFTNNKINDSVQYGFAIGASSSSNIIYNNFLNNSQNSKIYGAGSNVNIWNTTLNCTAEFSIFNGSCIGGNYWAWPNGTGFSDTCTDSDADDICDSNHTLDGVNFDYLPLSTPRAPVVSTTFPVQGVAYSVNVSFFNFTISDPRNDTCIYDIGNGNVTASSCAENISAYATQGNFSWFLFGNDTSALDSSTNISFYVDYDNPVVDNLSGMPANNSIGGAQVTFNWTVNDTFSTVLDCSPTVDGVLNRTYTQQTNNNSNNNVTYSLTGGYHWINVTCEDKYTMNQGSSPMLRYLVAVMNFSKPIDTTTILRNQDSTDFQMDEIEGKDWMDNATVTLDFSPGTDVVLNTVTDLGDDNHTVSYTWPENASHVVATMTAFENAGGQSANITATKSFVLLKGIGNTSDPSGLTACPNVTYVVNGTDAKFDLDVDFDTLFFSDNLTITDPNGIAYKLSNIENSYDADSNYLVDLNYSFNVNETGTWTMFANVTDYENNSVNKSYTFYSQNGFNTYNISSTTLTTLNRVDACGKKNLETGTTDLVMKIADAGLVDLNFTIEEATKNITVSMNGVNITENVTNAINYTALTNETDAPGTERRIALFEINSSLNFSNYDLEFDYSELEFSFNDESALKLWKCDNRSSCTLADLSATVNISTNTVTATNLTSFSLFMLTEPGTSIVTNTVTISGGGGTTTVYRSLNILSPGQVELGLKDEIIITIDLINPEDVDLNKITLTATPNTEDISVSFDRPVIAKVAAKTNDSVLMFIESHSTPGEYEILINAVVESPTFTETATLKVLLVESVGAVRVVERVVLAQDLFRENPQCLELNDLLIEAQKKLDAGDVDLARELVQAAITGCKDLVTNIETVPFVKVREWRTPILVVAGLIILSLIAVILIRKPSLNLYKAAEKEKKGFSFFGKKSKPKAEETV